MKSIMKMTLLIAIAVMFCAVGLASATPVAVPNFSFEDQGLGAGNSDVITTRAAGTAGWESTIGVKVYNPPGDGTSTYPAGVPDGEHLLYMETYNFLSLKAGVYMELDIKEGFEYTVKVELGGLTAWGAIGEGQVQAYAIDGMTPTIFDNVISGSPVTPPDNAWTTLEYSFTGTAAHVGYDILIELAESDASPTGYIHWDNLRVDEVPEPATMTLLGLGALGLLRRKKS
jgi:hypothetical protein